MPENFRTSFVGNPLDQSAIGSQIGSDLGGSIADAFAQAAEEKERKGVEITRQYGLDKASTEYTPAGIEPRFAGIQTLLDQYQEKAAIAKHSPSNENLVEYQRAKQEYMNFKEVAVTQSRFNANTAMKIRSGAVKGMVGTVDDNLATYDNYRKGPKTIFENGTIKVLEGGTFIPWNQSESFSADNIFTPNLEAEEAKYSVSRSLPDVMTNVVAPKADLYKVEDNLGFKTGEVDMSKASADIIGYLNTRGQTDLAQGVAISQHIYAQTHRNGGDLSREDVAKAENIYSPEMDNLKVSVGDRQMMVADVVGMGAEGISFSVTDDELETAIKDDEVLAKAMFWRKAKAKYYADNITPAVSRIPVKDETGDRMRFNMSQAKVAEREKGRAREDLIKEYEKAPALMDEGTYGDTFSQNVLTAPINVKLPSPEGEDPSSNAIEKIMFTRDGGIAGFEVSTTIKGSSSGRFSTDKSPDQVAKSVITSADPEFNTMYQMVQSNKRSRDIADFGQRKAYFSSELSDSEMSSYGMDLPDVYMGRRDSIETERLDAIKRHAEIERKRKEAAAEIDEMFKD